MKLGSARIVVLSILCAGLAAPLAHAADEKPKAARPAKPSAAQERADKAKGMLRLAGPGAGKQAKALESLLAAAPALAPKVEAAEWVGNRRWNLTFDTGQLLALPEGEVEAATALVKFARLDGKNRLLGGKVIAFDMRTPPRLYMRLPQAVGGPKVVAAPEENGVSGGETT